MDAQSQKTGTPASALEPKKFIRTFEGDAAILQKGGTPDLIPFPGEHETVSAETTGDISLDGVAAAPYEPAIQIPAPVPPPAAPPPAPVPLPKPEPVMAETVHTPPTVEVPPAPSVVVPPPPPMPPVVTVSPDTLKTYAGDFVDHVASEHASGATILAAEQDAGPTPRTRPPAVQHHRTWVYVTLGIVLFGLGGAGSYFAYAQYQTKMLPVAVEPTVSAPIFVDERSVVAGTSTPLLSAVMASLQKPPPVSTVRLLYETATTTADMSVFNALMLPAPDILLRNIVAQGSMAGIVNVGGTVTPFFILAVSSYSDTFAGMLSWEKTMPRDLSALFPANTSVDVASSTVATTTLALKAPPLFRDVVIANHDARVYQDAGGAVLVYGYWNQSTLVIARDQYAFSEILNRLGTSKSTQ